MSDLRLPVNTAVTLPLNILPLVDATDPTSIMASVAYNDTGMSVKWNFVTTAGVMTQTAVTPTNSGAYLWTAKGAGMYSIAMPASGGASANNDTEGYGWFTGVLDGVMPYRGPVTSFEPASTISRKDLGILNSGKLAAVTSTSEVTLASTASNNDDAYKGCYWQPTGGTGGDQNGRVIVAQVGRVITLSPPLDQAVDTTTTYNLYSGEQAVEDTYQTPVLATDHTGAHLATAAQVPSDTDNADAVWNMLRGGSRPANSFGEYVDSQISGVATGGVGADTIAAAVWAAAAASNATTGSHGAQLYTVVNALTTALSAVSGRIPTSLVNGRMASEAQVVGDKTGYVLSSTGSAPLTEAYPPNGQAGTIPQLLYLILSLVSQKSISNNTLTALKLDGVTEAARYRLNDPATPSSITRIG